MERSKRNARCVPPSNPTVDDDLASHQGGMSLDSGSSEGAPRFSEYSHPAKLRDSSRRRRREEQQRSSSVVREPQRSSNTNRSKSTSKLRPRDAGQLNPRVEQDERSDIVSLASSVEFHHSSQNLMYNNGKSILSLTTPSSSLLSPLTTPMAPTAVSASATKTTSSPANEQKKPSDGGGDTKKSTKLLSSSSDSAEKDQQKQSSSAISRSNKSTEATSSSKNNIKKKPTKRKLVASSTNKQQSEQEDKGKSTPNHDDGDAIVSETKSQPKRSSNRSSKTSGADGETTKQNSKESSSKTRGRKRTTQATSSTSSRKVNESRSRSTSRRQQGSKSATKKLAPGNESKTTTTKAKLRSISKSGSKSTSSASNKPSRTTSRHRSTSKAKKSSSTKRSNQQPAQQDTTTVVTEERSSSISSSHTMDEDQVPLQRHQQDNRDEPLLNHSLSSTTSAASSSLHGGRRLGSCDGETSSSSLASSVPEEEMGGSESLLDNTNSSSCQHGGEDDDDGVEEEESILLLDPIPPASAPVNLSQQASSFLLKQETSYPTAIDFDVDGPSEMSRRCHFSTKIGQNEGAKEKSGCNDENSSLTLVEHNNPSRNMSDEQRVWVGIRQVLQDADETDTCATTGFLPGDILQAMKESTHSGGTSTIVTAMSKTRSNVRQYQLHKQLSVSTTDVPSIAEDAVLHWEESEQEGLEEQDHSGEELDPPSGGEQSDEAETYNDNDTDDESGNEQSLLRKELCGGVGNSTVSAWDMPPPLDDPSICSVTTDMQSTVDPNSNVEKRATVTVVQEQSRHEDALKSFFTFLAGAAANRKGSTKGVGDDDDMPPLANSSFSSMLTDLQSRLAPCNGKEVVQNDQTDALQGFIDFLATTKGQSSPKRGAGVDTPDGDMPPLANSSFSSILTDLQSRLGDGKVIQSEDKQDDALRGFLDILAAASNGAPEEHFACEGEELLGDIVREDPVSNNVHKGSSPSHAANIVSSSPNSIERGDDPRPRRAESFLELLAVMMERPDDLPQLADKLLSGDSIPYRQPSDSNKTRSLHQPISNEAQGVNNKATSTAEGNDSKDEAPKRGKNPKMGRPHDDSHPTKELETTGHGATKKENRKKGHTSTRKDVSRSKRGDRSIETQATAVDAPKADQRGKKTRPKPSTSEARKLRNQEPCPRSQDVLDGKKDDPHWKGRTENKRGLVADKDKCLDVNPACKSPPIETRRDPFHGDDQGRSQECGDMARSGYNNTLRETATRSNDQPQLQDDDAECHGCIEEPQNPGLGTAADSRPQKEYDDTKNSSRLKDAQKEVQYEQVESHGYSEDPSRRSKKQDGLNGYNAELEDPNFVDTTARSEEVPRPVTYSTSQLPCSEAPPVPTVKSYCAEDDPDPFGLNELTCEEEPYEPYNFKDDPYAAANGELCGNKSSEIDHGYNDGQGDAAEEESDFEGSKVVDDRRHQTTSMPHRPAKQRSKKPGKKKKSTKKAAGRYLEENVIAPTSAHSNESQESLDEVDTVVGIESLPDFFLTSRNEAEREKNSGKRDKKSGLGRSLSSFLAPSSFLGPTDKNKKRYRETRSTPLAQLRKKIPFLKNHNSSKAADIVDTGCRDAQFYPGYLEEEEEEASVGALLSG